MTLLYIDFFTFHCGCYLSDPFIHFSTSSRNIWIHRDYAWHSLFGDFIQSYGFTFIIIPVIFKCLSPDHITSLLHNVFILIYHWSLKLNKLKSEILVILVPGCTSLVIPENQKLSMTPLCPCKHQTLCILLTQTSSIYPYLSISTAITLAKLLLSLGLYHVSRFHFAYVSPLYFFNIKSLAFVM